MSRHSRRLQYIEAHLQPITPEAEVMLQQLASRYRINPDTLRAEAAQIANDFRGMSIDGTVSALAQRHGWTPERLHADMNALRAELVS